MKRYVAVTMIGWLGLVPIACSSGEQPAGQWGATASSNQSFKALVSEQTPPQTKLDSPYVPPVVSGPDRGGSGAETASRASEPAGPGETSLEAADSAVSAQNPRHTPAPADEPTGSDKPGPSAKAESSEQVPPAPAAPEDPEAVKALVALGVTIEQNDQGQVKSVVATKGQMTDQAFALLGGLPGLEKLEIRGGKVTSKGLVHLKNLHGLQRLYLCDVSLDDEALKHLAGLTNLVCLSLEKTGITGTGLAYLKNLRNLEVLNLADNPIDDKAMAHLQALSRLDTITLRNTHVTGDGLIHLKGLERLRVLNLKECKEVTDESLEHLRDLKELRMLYVWGTQVSDEGAKKLKRQIPGLAVFFH